MYKLCVIGLGNPGSKYDHTRHNIGKDWLIDLSEKFSLEFKHKSKFQAEFAESHDGSILWIIPSNYVNDSGNTVSKILNSTNLTNENLFVLHDELDLKVGDILIFSNTCPHRSKKNNSNKDRRTLYYTYSLLSEKSQYNK